MACPFLNEVAGLDEEALIVRRACRRERVLRDRSDPLLHHDDHLYEWYRFSADGIRYLCRLLGPHIQHRTARSRAMTVPQMVCVALRFFASGMFLYSVGDAENLDKGAICRAIRGMYLALKSQMHVFITFPGHRRMCSIKEGFYKIAAFPNVIGALDCTHVRIKRPSGPHEGDFVNRKSFHSINVQMITSACHKGMDARHSSSHPSQTPTPWHREATILPMREPGQGLRWHLAFSKQGSSASNS
uniref:putative nuclease HARBI1 n=1 Tax=Epinephelus lanceolatus TaxID=310571 RepID=UPI001445CD7D|nr:putative nuclease HARBI1 [Epinephelus lanceolatus]